MTSCSLLCLLLFLTCASPQVFRAELCPSGTYVTISRLADNCVVDTHVVKQGRANKALRILHTAHLDSTESTRCCSKNCMEKFSRADLISRRLWYLDFATELEAKKALVNELKPHYDDTKQQRRQSYHMPMHQGNTMEFVACCSTYYARALGIAENKMAPVREAIQNGSTEFLHGNTGKMYDTTVGPAAEWPL